MNTPKKYRKKPVVIEADIYNGGEDEARRLVDWIGTVVHDPEDNTLEIETLEGVMKAQPGDYIIKGIKGEFYPCKPDIFEATYEEENND